MKWVDETAGFIKQLAPRQLVSTGNEGWMGTAGSKELFERSHATRNIDYLTFHIEVVDCALCRANLADLRAKAEPVAPAQTRQRRIYHSSRHLLPGER